MPEAIVNIFEVTLIYLAYLIDERAYPFGSNVPDWIAFSSLVQILLAVAFLLKRVRQTSAFCFVVVVSALITPVGLLVSGRNNWNMITSIPIGLFSTLQIVMAFYWISARQEKMRGPNIAMPLLLAMPYCGMALGRWFIDFEIRNFY